MQLSYLPLQRLVNKPIGNWWFYRSTSDLALSPLGRGGMAAAPPHDGKLMLTNTGFSPLRRAQRATQTRCSGVASLRSAISTFFSISSWISSPSASPQPSATVLADVRGAVRAVRLRSVKVPGNAPVGVQPKPLARTATSRSDRVKG